MKNRSFPWVWVFILGVIGCISIVFYINPPWSLQKKCDNLGNLEEPEDWLSTGKLPPPNPESFSETVQKYERKELLKKCRQLKQHQNQPE